jgi:LmbE family N-acetylglucosaminyl deacetylase
VGTRAAVTRILAVHAHPDDVETLCAGTLALLAEKGHAITIATLTAGDCGAIDTGPEETATIRKREAEASAKQIGARYVCAGFGDLSLFNDDASRRRVVELIRNCSPELVLTSAPVDYHPDHEAASMLVRDACFASTVPNYKAGASKPLAQIPHLYFVDPIEGRDRDGERVVPEFGVDITQTFAVKERMFACHKSQAGWEAKQHAIDDFVGAMERWTKRRGRTFGVTYAEGFRQYRCHPYPRTPLLQELVGEALLKVPA